MRAHREPRARTMLRGALLPTLAMLAGCSAIVSKPAPPRVMLPPPGESPSPPLDLPVDATPRVEPRSRFGNPVSYEVFGRRYYVLADARGFREQGIASWYGPGFHGERTSSGEPYDMYAMTAAHKTLPLPAYVRVQNLGNGRSVVVRVNDRGPFVGDRIIDLSYSAAARLDMLRGGTAAVEISVIEAPPAASPSGDSAAVVPPVAVDKAAGQWVQAGAFAQRANAERMVENLRRAGISNLAIQIVTRMPGESLYRVCAGPALSSIEADDLIERLALAGVPDARIAHPIAAQ